MTVKEVSSSDFEQEVGKSTGLVFVDFWADWCGPCKALAPHYESYSNTYKNAKFLKLDIMSAREIAAQLKISSIPNIVAFVNGVEVGRHIGAKNLEEFIIAHCEK